MICPKCSANTRVVDSRPHREDARVVVRKRVCEGCGRQFKTQEGIIDLVSIRKNKVRRQQAHVRRLDPAVRAARIARDNLRRDAKIEAAETGRPLEDILREWNVPVPHSLPRQQAPR